MDLSLNEEVLFAPLSTSFLPEFLKARIQTVIPDYLKRQCSHSGAEGVDNVR
jgi:hypothetical protein